MAETTATRRIVLSTLVVAVFGCAPRPEPPPQPVPGELQPLYGTIREYRHEYEKGIERIVAGDTLTGENMLAAASDRLSVAAQLCARTAGCNVTLFVNAMEHVFVERRAGDTPANGPATDEAESFEDTALLADALPQVGRTVALLQGIDLEEHIPMNSHVEAALNDWLTWNRPALMEAWSNYQFLREQIAPIYDEAGLPEALLFGLLAQESRGKVHAYSRAGAVGPLQFMRHTARRYGLHSADGFDMRLDPVAATEASVRYLDDQFRALNHDLEKALAAYNSGETRLRRLHRRNPDVEFWDERLYFALPAETRDYVPQIFAAAWLFLHGDRYGVVFPETETSVSEVVLREATSLGELTICLGAEQRPEGWFRTLRNLNPRRSPSQRIGAGAKVRMPSMLVPVYAERCVDDAELLARARSLHDSAYPEAPDTIRYTVRNGDTLTGIAARFGCRSVQRLAAVNGIDPPAYVIHPGQRLTVPTGS